MKFIVAVDESWGFSKNQKIPWDYPEDFQFFKNQTQDSICVMGYNTFKELAEMRNYPQKNKMLLPKRRCIVLTSHLIQKNEDITVVNSWLDIEQKHQEKEIYWIGGKSIYDHALTVCSEGWITRIKHNYQCDQFFDYSTLQEHFFCDLILKENQDLRFEHWVRKT